MIVPLLAYPHLSTSAKVLRAEHVEGQYILAAFSYRALTEPIGVPDPAMFRSVMAWGGCTGALLYWWGELAARMPGGVLDCPGYVRAWGDAYRAGEMAVGPLPWWLGDTGFHLRCQSKLLKEDPAAYGGHFVHAPLDIEYLWPTKKEHEWWTP